ncbi:MAG: GDP-mannose 4,6-dehydratase, partial [Bacteroidales bacterium]|nr:GDP-mannose 4,6-dehydratase [Bacteroidales bacterium]
MGLRISSAEYGNITPEDCPLKEERLLTPWTPYGVSKAGVEMLGRQYCLNFDMKIYLPRMFIHVGTGHPPATAIQNFARQLALIKKGLLEPEIHVGNLTSARDFIDVRDGVRAMRLLLDKGNPGEVYDEIIISRSGDLISYYGESLLTTMPTRLDNVAV